MKKYTGYFTSFCQWYPGHCSRGNFPLRLLTHTTYYYILNKTATIPINVRNYILSKGGEFERKMLRTLRNSVNTELRFQGRKEKTVSSSEDDFIPREV
ncbi:hypothetical protein GRJ2_002216800 [Grus japonensis]|uniref:Uncharacterized protein n=1 Tax=Grus japonensis TaxID=30415 RepID=A0ABC9XIL8_GRUJA